MAELTEDRSRWPRKRHRELAGCAGRCEIWRRARSPQGPSRGSPPRAWRPHLVLRNLEEVVWVTSTYVEITRAWHSLLRSARGHLHVHGKHSSGISAYAVNFGSPRRVWRENTAKIDMRSSGTGHLHGPRVRAYGLPTRLTANASPSPAWSPVVDVVDPDSPVWVTSTCVESSPACSGSNSRPWPCGNWLPPHVWR